MLVLKPHPVERFQERFPNIDPKWFFQAVAEINLYLPDDWRMTRSSNNFHIQILRSGHPSVGLVGYCYRHDDGQVLNIIDTVTTSEMINTHDLRKTKISGNSLKEATIRAKKEHPETFVPNLYFFQPRPEDSASPLFARQYEKIKKNHHDEQYHRLHPLTKAGLDLAHFRWVRWTSNCEVQDVDAPHSGYHGKDYWEIPLLTSEAKRPGDPAFYIKAYEGFLKEFNVTPPLPPEPSANQYETEYKFIINGNHDQAREFLKSVLEKFTVLGFAIEPDQGSKDQQDTYFDDADFSLYAAGALFRLRQKKDAMRVTLKKRVPVQKLNSAEQLYVRREEEMVISQKQKVDLMSGLPINVFPYTLLYYVAPGHGTLKPVLSVNTRRRIIIIRDAEHRTAELCFDSFHYEAEGKQLGPFFELEIESKGMPREVLKQCAELIEGDLSTPPSNQSKYERGIALMLN